MSTAVKIVILATVPVEHAREFMQHLRDFDATHEGVHLVIDGRAPDNLTAEEVQRFLDVDPPFPFRETVRKQ